MKHSRYVKYKGRHFVIEFNLFLSTGDEIAHGEITRVSEIGATGWHNHTVADFAVLHPAILTRLQVRADQEARAFNATVLHAFREVRIK